MALSQTLPDRLIGRAEDDARRADEIVDQLRELDQLRLRQRHRHRFLDQHVLAGLERGPRDLAMLLHRGEHEHEVDLGRPRLRGSSV